jgi:hypothetical protein
MIVSLNQKLQAVPSNLSGNNGGGPSARDFTMFLLKTVKKLANIFNNILLGSNKLREQE